MSSVVLSGQECFTVEERLCYIVERPVCRAEQDETCEGSDLSCISNIGLFYSQDVLTEKCEELSEEVCQVRGSITSLDIINLTCPGH